jgi:two-component system response regulator YesN
VLGELGCVVEMAPDAGVALALLSEPDHEIDLVLSDQRMPGMSGVELATEIARHHPGVRSVLVSAYADRRTALAAVDQGATSVLCKPVRIVDLQRVLEEGR